MCFWEGEANISLELRRGGSAVSVVATMPGGGDRLDPETAQSIDALGYKIQLIGLDPYPATQGAPVAMRYVALLRVGR